VIIALAVIAVEADFTQPFRAGRGQREWLSYAMLPGSTLGNFEQP